MIKSVIIDFDDTLCMTEAACFELENAALVQMGRVSMSRGVHLKTWGRPLFEAIAERSPGVDVEAFKSVFRPLLKEFIDSERLDNISEAHMAALDELIDLHLDIMVLTSRTEGELQHILAPDHKLKDKVKAYYHGGNTEFYKPDPRVFARLLAQNNLEPSECVYVGDSVSDAMAAKDAGLYFIASLESGLRIKEDFNSYEVDCFIERFTELPAAVKRLGVESILPGGSVSSPVRVGETVRRVAGPWTPTVQALLDYLVTHQFEFAPRPLGLDAQGREVLEFLPGMSAHRPWPDFLKRTDGLEQAAAMLRRYHDVVAGFVPAADALWRIGRRAVKPGEIIRHGDLGPWNMLWQDGALIGLVDWDLAEPGERITDVAQLAWYFVPLRGERGWQDSGFEAVPDVRARIQVICEAYGDFGVDQVLREVDRLQHADMDVTQRLGGAGMHPWNIFFERDGMKILQMENDWLQQYLRPVV